MHARAPDLTSRSGALSCLHVAIATSRSVMVAQHLGNGRNLGRVKVAHAACEDVERHPAVIRNLTRVP